jgi:hypothetical protein
MTTRKASPDVPQDVDALAPEPDVIKLASGFAVRVDKLKTRGMFKMLKIVTRGAGPIIMQMDLNFDNQDTFSSQLLGVVFMAVPEAEQEAIEFIQSMVTPADYNPDARTKDAEQKNKELFERLAVELDDPEPDDTFSIIEKIIENEAGNIQALGKRVAAALKIQLGSLKAKN